MGFYLISVCVTYIITAMPPLYDWLFSVHLFRPLFSLGHFHGPPLRVCSLLPTCQTICQILIKCDYETRQMVSHSTKIRVPLPGWEKWASGDGIALVCFVFWSAVPFNVIALRNFQRGITPTSGNVGIKVLVFIYLKALVWRTFLSHIF